MQLIMAQPQPTKNYMSDHNLVFGSPIPNWVKVLCPLLIKFMCIKTSALYITIYIGLYTLYLHVYNPYTLQAKLHITTCKLYIILVYS